MGRAVSRPGPPGRPGAGRWSPGACAALWPAGRRGRCPWRSVGAPGRWRRRVRPWSGGRGRACAWGSVVTALPYGTVGALTRLLHGCSKVLGPALPPASVPIIRRRTLRRRRGWSARWWRASRWTAGRQRCGPPRWRRRCPTPVGRPRSSVGTVLRSGDGAGRGGTQRADEMALTRTPRPPSSTARARTAASSAALRGPIHP